MGEYTKKNAQVIEEVVCPAYERLMAAVRELKGTGKNEEGLCGLPQGQEYYQVLVDQSVGTKGIDRAVGRTDTQTDGR